MNYDLKDPAGHPATVENASPYEAYRGECLTVLSEVAVSRVRAASDGIRAIVSILMQREVDTSCQEDGLKLSSITTTGLLSALVCCADFAEGHAVGDGAGHTKRFDCNESDHWGIYHAAGAAGEATKPNKATKAGG